MVRNAQDGSTGDGLASLVAQGAVAVVVVATGLLGLAVLAEVLRGRHRARRLVAAFDRTLPAGIRVAVVSLITVATAAVGVRPAGATDSVRGWLGHGPTVATSTTSTPAPPSTTSTTTTTTTAVTPSTTLPPPVVLEPPITLEHLDPPTTATTPPPTSVPASVSPAPPPAPSPPVVAPPAVTYVVVRGDCLWSIAERRLGAGVDARAIDRGWRAIYAANRVAIGDDPNLIHVGLTLLLPPLHDRP